MGSLLSEFTDPQQFVQWDLQMPQIQLALLSHVIE
jgi:hypothetical protein